MLILKGSDLRSKSGGYALIRGRWFRLGQEFSYSQNDLALQTCRDWLEKYPNILCFVILEADKISLWYETEVVAPIP